MRFISLCDGIGAAYEAWTPLDWVCVARAEIEAFPLAVTAQRQPGPRELGNVSQITEDQIALLGPVDVVIFGSPCQDLSVAGQRKGLAGARSGLFFDCLRVFFWAQRHCGARFALWENVPGAFSSHKGRDFALVVGAMAGCDDVSVPVHGWGSEGCAVGDHGMVEWAVLDAQWFGLAQRRKRVFALLDTGDWASRPPILLERAGLRGNSPPRREQGQDASASVAQGAESGCERGSAVAYPLLDGAKGRTDKRGSRDGAAVGGADDPMFTLRQGSAHAVAFAIQAGALRENPDSGPDGVGVQADHAYTLEARAEVQAVAFALRGREGGAMPEVQNDQAGALRAASGGSTRSYVAMAFQERGRKGGRNLEIMQDVHPALTAPSGGGRAHERNILAGYAVRRLTPVECARLQGFADDHCAVTYRKKPAADGPIYKALGNSMAVPVIRWIGEQIMIAELF